MRVVRIMMFCVVGISVMGAATAIQASAAAPEFGRCVKVGSGKGHFTSGSCVTEKEGGAYEWHPGVEKGGFTGVGGVITISTVNGTGVTCKTARGGGIITSPKREADLTVTFTGCESAGLHCNTVGAKEGELVSNTLEAEIGWEKKETKAVAIDIFPEGHTGLFATLNCGGSIHVEASGSIMARVTADTMQTASTIKWSANVGVQKPERFEGGLPDIIEIIINGGAPEQAGITGSESVTNEEAIEVNAVV